MDSEFLIFLAIFSGVIGLVFFVIAIANRCPACGSLTHGFKSDKVGDLDTGHAYFVCRKCGVVLHCLCCNDAALEFHVPWGR